MVKKILVFRGGAATGKSTAIRNLAKRKETKEWIIIDHPEFKKWFEGLKDKRTLQKQALFSLLKELLKTKKNIVLEEMSAATIRKYIGRHVKKQGYKIITFQFENKPESSYVRNVQRVKKKDKHHKKILTKKQVAQTHKFHKEKFDPEGILINTRKLGKRKVIELILKKSR